MKTPIGQAAETHWLTQEFLPLARSAIFLFLTAMFVTVSSSPCSGQVQPEVKEPKLLSIFPLGARKGTTVRAEVRGNLIAGAYAVWTDSNFLKGQVLKIEQLNEEINPKLMTQKPPDKPPAVYQSTIQLSIEREARAGLYAIRLVTPQGVSDTLPFRVLEEPVVVETGDSHADEKHAQAVTVPSVIHGKLASSGELDYYSFHAGKGETLLFEVMLSENCDPRLALYDSKESWLNPDRHNRLLMHEERSSDWIEKTAKGSYEFQQDGEYFLEVSSTFGKGTPGSTYQIRIASSAASSSDDPVESVAMEPWAERTFSRKLDGQWEKAVESRSVNVPENSAVTAQSGGTTTAGDVIGVPAGQTASQSGKVANPLEASTEVGPAKSSNTSQDVKIPSIVSGTIEHPGEIGQFTFRAGAGQKLAFEIEAPDARPPYFNPRLGVVDAQDHELFSNVERRLSMFNNNADPQVYLKAISPKAVFTFDHDGEYRLEVRDITSRYGGPDFRYKILLRPAIPHLGEISVLEGDRINLVRDEPRKLTLSTAYEEGYTGEVSFYFTGLPEGVRAFPAAQYDEGRAPLEVTMKPEIVAPSEQKTTIVLFAGPEARPTSLPVMVQLHGRPVLKGRMGADILVREMPIMILGKIPAEK